jgi:hypothetical protein
VPVQRMPSPVAPSRGLRVVVLGGVLDVLKRDAGLRGTAWAHLCAVAPSRPPPAGSPGTGSTAAATGKPTTPCGGSFESGKKGGDIHGFGDSAFFCAVQLLTISSSIKNPLTAVGKVIDVGLEVWGIFVVTVVAGSFATFFASGDAS